MNPANTSTLTKARKVGINIEMSLLSDQMRQANGKWVEETISGCGFNVMRWGYGAWEWDWANETPLTFDYWSAYNVGDDAGSFGLKEFIDLCKTSNSTPMLMIPVEIQKYPEHTWQNIKDMAAAMAAYVNSQGLATPVYFELGNEPAFTVSQATYESRLIEMSAVIKAVNPAFKFGASVNGPGTPYNTATLVANVGAAIDFIDFHSYTPIAHWSGYYAKDNDTFFTHASTSKEAFLGECNILWPDWNGRMPNDLQGSLPLLNGILNRIESDTEQNITTWPSHWPGLNGNEPYGLFNYNAWFSTHQTQLYTGPIYAHRIVNENVLDLRLTGETSSDAKVRVFAYANTSKSRLNVLVINKKAAAEPLTINTSQAFSYVQAFVLSAPALDSESPTYLPHLAAMTPVGGSTFTNTVPAQSAIVFSFYNDAATVVPGAFSLGAPAASSSDVSAFKTFTWSAASGAQSYRLTIANNSAFTTPLFDREVGLQTQYQLVETLLSPNSTYYWKVVAKNKIGQANASGNGRSFTTAKTAPIPFWSGEVFNGSFEDGLKGWVNWGGALRTSVAGEVIAGKYSGKVGLVTGGMGQDVFGLAPGATYQMHASSRTTSAADSVTMAVSFYNAAGALISEASWSLPQVTSLVHSVKSFTVPAGTWRSSVWFWKSGGNGNLFLDGIRTKDISKDNTDASGVAITGSWTSSQSATGYIGTSYVHDNNANKGSCWITYSPTLPTAGAYEVYLAYAASTNRATNVPITIAHASGTSAVTLNQQTGGGWTRIGSWNFAAGSTGSVKISNLNTNGYVIADAVRFSPISIHNGGFEENDSYWTNFGNAGTVTGNAHGGTKAMRVGTAAGGRGQNITTTAGLVYTLAAWGKVSVVNEIGWVGVSFYTSANVKIGEAGIEFVSTAYTGDSVLFTTPAGTAYMQVWVWKDAGAGGYFYADDITLRRQ